MGNTNHFGSGIFFKYPYLLPIAITKNMRTVRIRETPQWVRSSAGVLLLALLISAFTWGLSTDHSLSNFGINYLFNFLLTATLTSGLYTVANHVHLSWVDQPVRHFLVTASLTIVLVVIATLLTNVISSWVCCNANPLRVIRSISLSEFMVIFLVTGVISGVVHGREFLRQWKASILEAEQLKQAYVASEYELLRQQVNPHFLFNSLNVLHTLVYQDADQSARFIRQLSKVYRYVLEGNREEIVTLDRELDILEAYLSLLATRFGESLQVRFDIDPGQEAKGIIPLSLQMLVENVVKHNDIRENQPLRIDISSRDGILWVRNERRATVAKRGTTGLGLQNIRDRYRHLTGKDIVVQPEADTFCVGLPLIPMRDERRIDRG